MIKKIIDRSIVISATIIFLVSLTLSLIFILFLITRNVLVDSSNVDLFDLVLKASLTFIGSSLSGFIALFIFYLNKKYDKKERDEENEKYRDRLDYVFKENIDAINSLITSISSFNSGEIVSNLNKQDGPTRELIIILYTKIDFDVSQEYLKEIDKTAFLERIDKWTDIKKFKNYLYLLLYEVKNENSAAVLVEELKKVGARLKA